MPRLDQELTIRGLARSRTQAAQLISEGAVFVAGAPAHKASREVTADQEITVRLSDSDHFVSRAAHKLLGALAAFSEVAPAGKRCLDAGASTGGFTQVLLEVGAREVVAVDVGHGQLVPGLRADPRVRVYEGLNIRELVPELIDGKVQLTVADLSFISLRLVLAPLADATVDGGDLLVLVKPQFEVGRERLAKTGVVGSDQERRRAVSGVAKAALETDLELCGLAPSPLPGQDGNIEYFLWLRKLVRGGQSKLGVQDVEMHSADEFLRQWWPGERKSG